MTIRVDGEKLYLYLRGGWQNVGHLSNRVLTLPKPPSDSVTIKINYNLLQEARLFDWIVIHDSQAPEKFRLVSRKSLVERVDKMEESQFEKEVEFTLEEIRKIKNESENRKVQSEN